MLRHELCRTRGQHHIIVTAEILWSERCSSLVVKYANAIGLSERYKAGDFPNDLETKTWKLRASITSTPTTNPNVSIVSSYRYEIGTPVCFGEQSSAPTTGVEPDGCFMLIWPV